MSVPRWLGGPPRRILLATDLSARSDRALDRAVSLAKQWQAQLTVLHALEDSGSNASHDADRLPSWKRGPDPIRRARADILADLGEQMEKAAVVIEEGDPVESIVGVAEREECDLIVIGVARNEMLGLFNLGRTVDGLIRRSRVPLLIVKNRARHSYRDIVVATDFSESSRHALDAALHFFPKEHLTIFHAYNSPMSGLMTDATAYRRDYRKIVEQDYEGFLRNTDIPQRARPLDRLIEYGAPDRVLYDYAMTNAVDLVVLGTHGRSAFFNILIGSVARKILDDVPCDVLLVREPRAGTAE